MTERKLLETKTTYKRAGSRWIVWTTGLVIVEDEAVSGRLKLSDSWKNEVYATQYRSTRVQGCWLAAREAGVVLIPIRIR